MCKLKARERIYELLDDQSFVEFGALIGKNGSSVITGYGTINDRLVYLYSEDYTIDGALIDSEASKKICDIMEMSIKMGAPLIQIIDSAGTKISEGLNALSAYSKIIGMNSKLSGVVPQITVIAGPCTGVAAISTAMSDVTIMVESSGELYINAPELIDELQSKYVRKEMYSKAEKASKNGSVHIITKDDKEAMGLVRTVIDYLPANNMDFTTVSSSVRNTHTNKSLDEIVNQEIYDLRMLIEAIADRESVLELGKHITDSVVTALIRIKGITAGVIASNRNVAEGRFDKKACEKTVNFIKFCNSFNISVITLVDSKGFVADAEEENNGLAVAAARLLYSLAEANVPKIALIIGHAYGAGFITMASKETGFDVVYAWPQAKISISDPESIIKVLNKEEIAASDNPNKKKEELLAVYMEESCSAHKAAELGFIDDILEPAQTALRFYSVLDMLQTKRVIRYPKKYGNALI